MCFLFSWRGGLQVASFVCDTSADSDAIQHPESIRPSTCHCRGARRHCESGDPGSGLRTHRSLSPIRLLKVLQTAYIFLRSARWVASLRVLHVSLQTSQKNRRTWAEDELYLTLFSCNPRMHGQISYTIPNSQGVPRLPTHTHGGYGPRPTHQPRYECQHAPAFHCAHSAPSSLARVRRTRGPTPRCALARTENRRPSTSTTPRPIGARVSDSQTSSVLTCFHPRLSTRSDRGPSLCGYLLSGLITRSRCSFVHPTPRSVPNQQY